MGGTEVFKIFGRIGLNGADDVNKKLQGVGNNADGASSKLVSAFKKIGGAVATYLAVDKIVGFGQACVDAAAGVAAETAAFEQIMGKYSDSAQKKIDEIADATGITNSRLTPYMTSMSAKFKGLGYGVDEATGFAQRGLTLAADASAFWDKSLDESMSHLNSFINGSYEGGEAIGLFANDTQMAAYAVEQGIVKETKAWSSLDEATKQATRLEYAENMMKQSGATGQAAKEAGAYANVQANLNEAWRQFKAAIGEPILNNIVLPAMQKLSEILPTITEKIGPIAEKIVSLGQDIGEFWNEWILPAIQGFIDQLGVAKENLQPVIDAFTGFVSQLTGGANGFDLLRIACQFFESALAFLGEAIVNISTAFVDFCNWLNGGSTGAEVFKAVIVAVTAALVVWKTSMMIQGIVSSVVSGIGKVTSIFKGLWATMMANPITLIIAVIVALVAGFIYLWNNCEGFRNFWINLWNNIKNIFSSFVNWCRNSLNSMKNFFANAWDNIKSKAVSIWNGIKSTLSNVWNSVKTTATNVWNGIKNAIMTPIENARDKIKGVIDKIKGFFSFKISWPKIPMPKFGISPSGWKIGDLLKGTIPKLSIKWNAKGAVLDKPTIFGISGNTLMGGGEAGKEAVAPINTLQEYVRSAVRSELETMENGIMQLVEIVNEYLPVAAQGKNIVLDTGVFVGQIAPTMDVELGRIANRKGRGR